MRDHLIARAARALPVVIVVGLVVALLAFPALTYRAVRADQEAQGSKIDATHSVLVQVRRELRNSTAILAVLNDCLHPGGKCYARSKASTADVLWSARVIIIAAEACTHESKTPSDYSALAVCVDQLVRQHQ